MLVGTSYAFISTVVALGAAIVIRPLMVRLLGIGPYGVLVLGLSLLGIVTLAADLGIGSALTKYVAAEKSPDGRSRLITTGLGASFVSGLVLSGIILALAAPIASFFQIGELAPVLYVLAWQSPFAFAGAAGLAAVNGLRWMRAYSLASVLTNLSALVLVAAVLLMGGGLVVVAAAMVASSAVSLSVLVFILRNHLHWAALKGAKTTLRGLVIFGIQMSAANAVSTVLYQVDTALLGAFTHNDSTVGYYNIAVLVARLLWLVPGSISLVAFPAISEYTRDRFHDRTQKFVDRALRFSAALVGLGAIGLVYLGRVSLELVFGPEGLPAYAPLVVLLVGAGVLGVSKSVAVGLSSVGRPDLGFRIAMVGLGASLALNLLLIPSLGLMGAAIATSVAYFLLGIIVIGYLGRVLQVKIPFGWLAEAFAWSVALSSGILVLRAMSIADGWVQWVTGAGAMVVFVGVLYLRLIPAEDTEFLLSTIRQALRRRVSHG